MLKRLHLRREILKQLGVTPSSPPPQEEPLFLPEAPRGATSFKPFEALWNRTDVVRALCFKRPWHSTRVLFQARSRSRRFLLGAESDLMRCGVDCIEVYVGVRRVWS